MKIKIFIIVFNDSMIEARYENNDIQPYVVFGKFKIEYYWAGYKTNIYCKDMLSCGT